MIITVAQQKGGVGKTTVAAHLAVAWSARRKVALIDMDPQGSLSIWHEVRQANGIQQPVFEQVAGHRVVQRARALAAENDIVVIDSPPHAQTDARLAIRCADLVVLPLQPSLLDLQALQATLALARDSATEAVLVMNRVPARGRLFGDVSQRVQAMDLPLAKSTLGNRVAFAESMAHGRTATETHRRSRASEEVAALARELESWIG